MTQERDKTYDLEKQKVAARLVSIENVIKEAMVLNKKMYVKIYGDSDANPPVEGHEERLKKLELSEKNREKNKENLIKMALGAVTIAVGSVVLWVFTVLKNAFFHKI